MGAPSATMQEVLQIAEQRNLLKNYSPQIQKIFNALLQCHTPALGYHKYVCDNKDCAHVHLHYNSCGNRHCPQCGALKKEQWISDRMSELLPVKYYHVVFTMPHELNSLCLGNRKQLFDLLFETSAAVLQTFSRDVKYMGATAGITAILHTWGQQLSFHPHIHCIVSGGGLDSKGNWKNANKDRHAFLFPVKAMSMVYRTLFLKRLKALISSGKVKHSMSEQQWNVLKETLYKKDWIVYCKRPFGGPQQVIEYLGRYTHKVAISNHRLQSVDAHGVSFLYKDYADDSKTKTMRLSIEEFLRRFAQHILPKGFTKIRMYGYLSNCNRTTRLKQIQKLLKLPRPMPKVKLSAAVMMLTRFAFNPLQCPKCKQGTLELIEVVRPRSDPFTVMRN